jgi:hypothetical protein
MSNPGERHYFGGPPPGHSNNLSRDPDLNGLFSSGFSSGLPLGRGEQHTHTLRGVSQLYMINLVSIDVRSSVLGRGDKMYL